MLSFGQNNADGNPETIKLMKEAYKDKCFGKSTIFIWHGDYIKKGVCL